MNNYFLKNWNKVELKSEFINYILPIEDLDDISLIKKIKNNIDTI